MDKMMIFFVAFIALFASTHAAVAEYAVAKMYGFNSDIVGEVYFVPVPDQAGMVAVYANISGITQNVGAQHGMHIHEYGDFTNNGTFVGGHYKGAANGVHACPPNASRDAGDMGNWNVLADGRIDESKTLDLINLSEMYSIIGRAVTLHELTDDCAAVSSSGSRLARGIIGVGNPQYFPTSIFTGYPSGLTGSSATNPGTHPDILRAVAFLTGTTGYTVSAKVTFQMNSDTEMHVTAIASGSSIASTSAYGIHVHEFGDLTLSTGASVGGHYNPFNTSHGLPPSTTRHLGDMGSICTFDSAGVGYYSYTNTLTSIKDVHSIIGRGVIIHLIPDNGAEPYGTRIAQGVIGIAYPETVAPVIPDGMTVDDPACGTKFSTTGAATTGATASTAGGGSTTTTTAKTSATTSTSSATHTIATSIATLFFGLLVIAL